MSILSLLLNCGIYGSIGYGVYQAIDGIDKIGEATTIKNEAQSKFNQKNNEFGLCLSETDASLRKLGRVKLEVWDEFKEFIDAYSKIHAISTKSTLENERLYFLNIPDLDAIKGLNCTARDIAREGLITIGEGVLIEIGLSTFSKISRKNSEEIKVLGGVPISCATAVSATALISGYKIYQYGKDSLREAEDYARALSLNITRMNDNKKKLELLKATADELYQRIKNILDVFKKYVSWLKAAVILERDFKRYTKENQQRLLFVGRLAGVLKDLTLIKLLSDSEKGVGEQEIQSEQLDDVKRSIEQVTIDIADSMKRDSVINNKTIIRGFKKVYPNEKCPCGSGKKYKNCCKAYVDRHIILSISA